MRTEPWPVGSVVQRVDRTSRGVVTHVYREGDINHHVAACVGDMVVSLGVGHDRVTNIYGSWLEVPRDQWTAEERVRVAVLCWQPVPNYPEARADDQDSLAFAAVQALLFPEGLDEDLDWPTDIVELCLKAARREARS